MDVTFMCRNALCVYVLCFGTASKYWNLRNRKGEVENHNLGGEMSSRF